MPGMLRSALVLATAGLFLVAATSFAGIPDSDNSPAYADDCGRMTIVPSDGDEPIRCVGDYLGDLGYTVHVWVNDINNAPVDDLLATDLWLEHPEMVRCGTPHSQADAGTDANGHTTFSGPIYGGVVGDAGNGYNCDDMLLYVYAVGIMLNGMNPVCVATDSPDLNGDCCVSLADFTKFAVDYNCVPMGIPCDPCHDFSENGETSLADFTLFASWYRCGCP